MNAAEGLRKITHDDALVDCLIHRPTECKLPAREQALVAYALKLTVAPSRMERADVDFLRSAGWKDKEIFAIALVTSWCNMNNRMADGLGYRPDANHRFQKDK